MMNSKLFLSLCVLATLSWLGAAVYAGQIGGATAGQVTISQSVGACQVRMRSWPPGRCANATLDFAGYENATATAQTIAISPALATAPIISGQCPPGLSATRAQITLPSNMAAPFTGVCTVGGPQ
jgi:hypothetical protein